MIGYGLWQRAFGGDPAVLGHTVRINGQPFTLVGVTARGYFGVSNGGFFPPADVTAPLAAQPLVAPRGRRSGRRAHDVHRRRTFWLRVMARMKPGADRATVQAPVRPPTPGDLSAAEGNDRSAGGDAGDHAAWTARAVSTRCGARSRRRC